MTELGLPVFQGEVQLLLSAYIPSPWVFGPQMDPESSGTISELLPVREDTDRSQGCTGEAHPAALSLSALGERWNGGGLALGEGVDGYRLPASMHRPKEDLGTQLEMGRRLGGLCHAGKGCSTAHVELPLCLEGILFQANVGHGKEKENQKFRG